jgi:hypothetical protein
MIAQTDYNKADEKEKKMGFGRVLFRVKRLRYENFRTWKETGVLVL